jgi:hypothetical protein
MSIWISWIATGLKLLKVVDLAWIMMGEIIKSDEWLRCVRLGCLQIRSDVERQGDFIRFLIKEVEGAAFADIDDVVTFVKWLDVELSRLVQTLWHHVSTFGRGFCNKKLWQRNG